MERLESKSSASEQPTTKPPKTDFVKLNLGNPRARWEGGERDLRQGAELDSYYPTELNHITLMLGPLHELLKKACYVSD